MADPSPNGSGEPSAGAEVDPATAVLAELRSTPANVHLLRGYGPLVAALVVAVLMVLLLPSVAPERIVERPVETPGSATTTTGPPGPPPQGSAP